MTAKLDWQRVATRTLHPCQVEILKLLDKQVTLSPVDFFHQRENGMSLSGVAYHFRALEKCGVIRKAGERPVRGATEHIYRLAGR